jgi:hypothetical protein
LQNTLLQTIRTLANTFKIHIKYRVLYSLYIEFTVERINE